jgi:hypothetical protein
MAEVIFYGFITKDTKKVRFEVMISIPHFKEMSLVYILQLRGHTQTLLLNSYHSFFIFRSPEFRYQPWE